MKLYSKKSKRELADNGIIEDKDEDNDQDDDHDDEQDEDEEDNNDHQEEEQENDYRKNDNCKEQQRRLRKQHLQRPVAHGFHLVEGRMNHGMEDFIVAEKRESNGHELGLYAIFDGHSGHKVAEYLQHHLFDNMLNEPDFCKRPKHAIRRAYMKTDDKILKGVVGSRGGSTAVTAILVDRKKLLVANVGDSRAILCRNGVAKQISIDHEPERERDLVESKGGFVIQRPGNVPRVDGQLAMTRAFGDEKVKDHITSEPDIICETIDSDTRFIILASDGLWKVMSNQDAADYILDIEDPQEAAETLIKEALTRKSADDISCVVVKFG